MKFCIFLCIYMFGQSVLADGDYSKHFSDMQGHFTQIQSLEKSIREHIEEKNKTQDREKLKEIIINIKKQLKDRKEAIEKYEKEYHHLKYEHPSKGSTEEFKYKKIDSKYEKAFEDEINGLLSGIMVEVKNKYTTEKNNGH